MSLVKFNDNRWPWNYGLTDFFERNTGFDDDFFNLEKSVPAMNVKEHEDDFEIELASPGFDKKDFEITLKDDILEVAAEKRPSKRKKKMIIPVRNSIIALSDARFNCQKRSMTPKM